MPLFLSFLLPSFGCCYNYIPYCTYINFSACQRPLPRQMPIVVVIVVIIIIIIVIIITISVPFYSRARELLSSE